METVHIRDLLKMFPDPATGEPSPFVRIDFSDPTRRAGRVIDPEFAGKVLAVDSALGPVTIVFDEYGEVIAVDFG